MSHRPRLLLFDVDGTLVNAGGAGRRSIDRALRELVNTSEPPAAKRSDGPWYLVGAGAAVLAAGTGFALAAGSAARARDDAYARGDALDPQRLQPRTVCGFSDLGLQLAQNPAPFAVAGRCNLVCSLASGCLPHHPLSRVKVRFWFKIARRGDQISDSS